MTTAASAAEADLADTDIADTTRQHDHYRSRYDHGRRTATTMVVRPLMWYVGASVVVLISIIALFQEDRIVVHLLPNNSQRNSGSGSGRNGGKAGNRRGPTVDDDVDFDIMYPLTPSLFLHGGSSRMDDIHGSSKIKKKNYSSFLWYPSIDGRSSGGGNFTGGGNNLNLFPKRDETHIRHDASISESKTRPSVASSSTAKIQRIVVLGERHSGTTFVTKYLQECFGNARNEESLENNQQSTTNFNKRIERIDVTDRFVNTKHWFQPSPEYVVHTVLNDLFRTQQDKHPNGMKKLSTSSPNNQFNQFLSSFSSSSISSSSSSSYIIGSDDDIDLQWWKEIVFGRKESNKNGDNDEISNDYSITSIEELMELDGNLRNRTTASAEATTTTTTKIFNQLLKKARRFFESTFVILLVRDPYDWVEAVRRKPWHWPNHIELYERTDAALERANATSKPHSFQKSLIGYRLLDWEKFVSSKMTLAPQLSNGAQTSICQKGLPKGYVSPCRRNKDYIPPKSIPARIPKSFLRNLPFDVNDPIYELNMVTDRSQPYRHPLELRTAKLENMLALPKHWFLAGFNVVPYESLGNGGLESLTNDILSVCGTQKNNNSFACRYGPHERSFVQQRSYNISFGYKSWINENSNWDIENLVGYHN